MKTISLLLSCIALLAGCANPSITSIDSSAKQMKGARVCVTRFEGDPTFVEESTDMFIAELRARAAVNLIQGGSLRTEGTDILAGSNMGDQQAAVQAARRAGAAFVILGKVSSYKTDATMNGFTTIHVVRVSDGTIIATIHRPSGLLVGYSEHQAVMASAKRVADALATAIQ